MKVLITSIDYSYFFERDVSFLAEPFLGVSFFHFSGNTSCTSGALYSKSGNVKFIISKISHWIAISGGIKFNSWLDSLSSNLFIVEYFCAYIIPIDPLGKLSSSDFKHNYIIVLNLNVLNFSCINRDSFLFISDISFFLSIPFLNWPSIMSHQHTILYFHPQYLHLPNDGVQDLYQKLY